MCSVVWPSMTSMVCRTVSPCTGFGVSLVGVTVYRGFQLGTFDTLVGLNPFVHDKGIPGLVSRFASAQTTIIATPGITYPFGTVT